MNRLLPKLLILLLLQNGRNSFAQLCTDTSLHLLMQEDTLAVTANIITKTRDGNFLIPGYYYPNEGLYYNMPYLIKCTGEGNVLWSKRYSNSGVYPSDWFTAGRVQELKNGDLLMTGQIGVPGTDDRRELAVWRLDKNGALLWGTSYESSLWTNPITGATEITGIQEDGAGNIFLCGDNKLFEASKFAFVLKLDAKGNVLWDNDYRSSSAFAYGLVLFQSKLLLVGGLGPLNALDTVNQYVLWCIQLNPVNGQILSTSGWSADFGGQSSGNSFYYANTSVNMLDNGRISVQGTAHADFLGLFNPNADSINHSIIAEFSPDFVFRTGIMLGSRRASNYYNTVATQQGNGRISYTRFVENNHLYHEDIIYGSCQNNQSIRERIYHEQNRSAQTTSNFLFFPPGEDMVVQTYWDTIMNKGGLEIFRLQDGDSSGICNGKDTSTTFVLPYSMKEAQVVFDSIAANTFRQTYHNSVGADAGNLSRSTGCMLGGVKLYGSPIVALDQDSVLCRGSTRELTAGQGYSRYIWNTGDTGSSLLVSDTGKYWVAVTAQNGCKGSDTTYIVRIAPDPAGFLPADTTICQFDKLTITPLHTYQSYLWSDQSTAPTLTVSQPGLYRLEVTDSNQCAGADSIRLIQKQCLEGFFIPNAFTPNGDGHNEIFRPMLLGTVDGFRFAVYNRWGEKVFETHTPGQGWDGRLNGAPLPTGTFIWLCQYQFNGQAMQIRNGTVLLIR